MKKQIPYGKQELTQDDISAVINVLNSDFWTQGPEIIKFEKAFAKYVDSKYAIAVSNGTAALHLCSIALDVKPGDKVITTPITFVASANCVNYCGGEIVFADIDIDSYLLDINKVRLLLQADIEKKIKGIIPVNFAGKVVDMEAFRLLADEFNCWIIEDACHSPGGSFFNSKGDIIKAGSGKYSELSIFSFHPVKHIAAGEGGMITTNSKELYLKILELRSHGIIRDENKFTNSINLAYGQNPEKFNIWPKWYMEMQSLGYNYRISDINCALGFSQLKRASKNLLKRHEIAYRYYKAFKNILQIKDRNNLFLYENKVLDHAYHLYVIEVDDRAGLYNYLRENNIMSQVHYFPCHLMPYYKEQGWKIGDMPFAEKYYERCISLPIYPSLSREEQDYVIDKVKLFLNFKK